MAGPSALKYRLCLVYGSCTWTASGGTPRGLRSEPLGTSMHAALRDFFRVPVGQRSRDVLLEYFKRA